MISMIIPRPYFSIPVDPGIPVACKNTEVSVIRILLVNANMKDITATFFSSKFNTKMK